MASIAPFAPRTEPAPLTADQMIAFLQRSPELSIEWGKGSSMRSLCTEDEPRAPNDFCSFRASRAISRNGIDVESRRFDHLEEALQWLLAR